MKYEGESHVDEKHLDEMEHLDEMSYHVLLALGMHAG